MLQKCDCRIGASKDESLTICCAQWTHAHLHADGVLGVEHVRVALIGQEVAAKLVTARHMKAAHKHEQHVSQQG